MNNREAVIILHIWYKEMIPYRILTVIAAACIYSADVCAFIRRSPIFQCSTRLSMAKNRFSPPTEQNEILRDSDNGYAFEVELPKGAGIDWGADLSFSWVYVLKLDPQGEAFKCNLIQEGDYVIGIGNTSVIAKDFDFVLNTLKKYPEPRLMYTFFRGTKRQLVGDDSSLILNPTDINITVTVQQKDKPDIVLDCPGGTNLRRLLISNGINVYRSLTRWTNCNGGQRCGTCIVDVEKGIENCNRKDLNEATVLAENPSTARLACITSVYGDVTVTVQGPVGAAQWTR